MKRLTFFSRINAGFCSITTVVLMVLSAQQSFAQLKPVNASYFFNEYIINPSMAGREEIFKGNIGYRKQFSPFNGAPETQFLTADYGFNSKSGVGLKIYSDKAGVLRETTIGLSYAYHLPISGNDHISFGLSATLLNNQLNMDLVRGDMDDPDVLDVNQRKTYLDTDFGISYTSKKLTIQAVFPNMLATLKSNRVNQADYLIFFLALSYRMETSVGDLEPKIAFRGIQGFKNVVDLGARLAFKSTTQNHIDIIAMYHSSKSASVGLEFMFNKKYGFNTSYTMATSQLNNYTVGDFEIGLSLKL